MTDNPLGGVGLGRASGSIDIDVTGIVSARKIVADASRDMTSSMTDINRGSNAAEQGLNKVEKAAKQVTLHGRALSEVGRALSAANIPGGGMVEAGGKILNAVNGIKQVDAALEPFVMKLVQSGGLIGGLVDKFGGLISVTTGLGVGLSGVLAVALPVVGVLGTVALLTAAWQRSIEKAGAGIQTLINTQDQYYSLIAKATTKQLEDKKKDLETEKDIIKKKMSENFDIVSKYYAGDPNLGNLTPENFRQKFQDTIIIGEPESVTNARKKWEELNGSLEDNKTMIDRLNKAIKDGTAAGNDRIEADKATIAQDEAFAAHKERNDEIDAQANEQLLEAQQDYRDQRAKFEKDFIVKMNKAEADENKRHLAAVAANEKAIQDIRGQAAQRAAQAEQEIAGIQDQARQDEIKAERDHEREMADMQREHRENLLEAAARLDAWAVFNEMKQFRERKSQAEQGYQNQRDQERESVQKHIQSVQERVATDNAADAARIEKMKADFAEQESVRQADYKAKKQEMIQQGNEESALIDEQFRKRYTKIDAQHTKELQAENTRFVNEFNALGVHNGRMLNLYKTGLSDLERETNNWFLQEQNNISKRAVASGYSGPIVTYGPVATSPSAAPAGTPVVTPIAPPTITYTPPSAALPYQPTKHVGGSGRAGGTSWANTGDWVHAGEVVASRPVGDLMRRALGSDFTQADLAAVFSQRRGDVSISVPVTAPRGMSPREIGAMVGSLVEQKLIEEFEKE